MITAVDSNVLIDIFEPDPTYGLRARDALKLALVEGEVVACDVVWAEVAATFGEVAAAESEGEPALASLRTFLLAPTRLGRLSAF